MANEQLTIQPNDARMTVIGKSWPDQATDSGGGDWDDTYNGTYSGPIPRTDLPVKIAVTTPPTKTEYEKNERIDFDGMVVTAYKEDGSVWTSADYPDGTIPLNEIISTRRTAKGVAQPEDNTVLYGSGVDPEYGTNFSFLLCKHFHIEGIVDNAGSISAYDFTASDDATILVFTQQPVVYDYGTIRYFEIDIVAKRASTYNDLCKSGVYCASGFYKYESHFDGWKQYIEYEYVADNTNFHLTKNNQTRYSRIMRHRKGSGVGHFFSSFIEGEYSCNIPLRYAEWDGQTSIMGGGTYANGGKKAFLYLYVDSFENVSDVTLYWQRPGDGLYLSCTLHIFIKSDNSD